ncbi:MAG: murein biosynthesis integral membrane protein MurJ [Deltaproteobacteria bacterium]|nr:murein biosynthesis integral membrane protein MurJ [Deltaproteobacteria bacterium]
MSRKFSTVPKPSNSENRKLGYAAGVVSFFTFLSRILGLVRDMVIAGLFGSGLAADAFFVAFRIPNLLRRLFAEGSLTIAFIPIFTEYLTLKTRKDAFDLARVVLTLLSILLALVTVLGILFSPWIVRVQAFGFGGSGIKYDLTVLLTRIMFPYIFFISLVAFFMGVLNSLRRFAAPAAAPILLNVGIIAAAYLISPHCAAPIVGIAIGVLIGGALQVGLQIPSVIREGLILLPKWNPAHPALKRIGFLMLPAIFGSAVYQVNQFMGTLLATFLEEGSVSWLYYADRLVQFPLGIFAIAISTAALPSLSTEAAKNDLVQFQSTLNHALCLVFFITFPSMAGLMVLGEPLVQLLFERGAFDSHASIMTARALLYYTVGLWAFSGVRVMVSAFYALQDTKTPVKVATVALALNLALSLLLMGPLKHGGLALALSLASSVQFCLLIFLLKRRGSIINIKPVIISSAKSALAAALMGVGVYGCFSRWLTIDPETGVSSMGIHLAALIVIGIIIYFGAARVLGCNEIRSIRYMLWRKRTKRRSAG